MNIRLLIEHPHISRTKIALFARKDGVYDRPILARMVDVRFEDMKLQAIQSERRLVNLIGKLPDIAEANQVGKWLIATFGASKIIDNNAAIELLNSNQYFELPSDKSSEHWEHTNRPWWEYVECYDKHGGIIKAALMPRSQHFTAENVDEVLDQFEENMNTLEVLGPKTIEKLRAQSVKESYIEKLAKI